MIVNVAPFIRPPLTQVYPFHEKIVLESMFKSEQVSQCASHRSRQKPNASPGLLRPSFRIVLILKISSRKPVPANARRPRNLRAISRRITTQTGLLRTLRHRRRGAEKDPALIGPHSSYKGITVPLAARPATIIERTQGGWLGQKEA